MAAILGNNEIKSSSNCFQRYWQTNDGSVWQTLKDANPSYTAILDEILLSRKEIQNAISCMKLEKVHLDQPLVNGKKMKEIFTNIPKGSAFGQLVEAQINWRLEHPSGSIEECIEFLKETFASYI